MQPPDKINAYDFTFDNIDGGKLPLADYRGQVMLIVNTASRCSFTVQYGTLRELQEKYQNRGFTVIGVPSNDFRQEPDKVQDVRQMCQEKYLVNFPLTAKEHILGKHAHPFYKWARRQGGFFSAPKWNFHKYLIGRDGNLISWHFSGTSPLSSRITSRIEQQL